MKRTIKIPVIVIAFLLVQLFVTGLSFKLSAETKFTGKEGRAYHYAISNAQLGTLKYVCQEGKTKEAILLGLLLIEEPIWFTYNNTELNPEVAIITKKHGNSCTITNNGILIQNIYVDGHFECYVWK